jgi:hypothetical protein
LRQAALVLQVTLLSRKFSESWKLKCFLFLHSFLQRIPIGIMTHQQLFLKLNNSNENFVRLAQRLLSISKEQDIQVDMTTMLALCEKAEYDIRSCLATLYFLKAHGRPLRYSDVMNLNIGHKDNHKSLFQGKFILRIALKYYTCESLM